MSIAGKPRTPFILGMFWDEEIPQKPNKNRDAHCFLTAEPNLRLELKISVACPLRSLLPDY